MRVISMLLFLIPTTVTAIEHQYSCVERDSIALEWSKGEKKFGIKPFLPESYVLRRHSPLKEDREIYGCAGSQSTTCWLLMWGPEERASLLCNNEWPLKCLVSGIVSNGGYFLLNSEGVFVSSIAGGVPVTSAFKEKQDNHVNSLRSEGANPALVEFAQELSDSFVLGEADDHLLSWGKCTAM